MVVTPCRPTGGPLCPTTQILPGISLLEVLLLEVRDAFAAYILPLPVLLLLTMFPILWFLSTELQAEGKLPIPEFVCVHRLLKTLVLKNFKQLFRSLKI